MPNEVILLESGLLELLEGPMMTHTLDVAGDVANQALAQASGRPGPNVVTGDLIKGIRTERDTDENGPHVNIFSEAQHGEVDYPSLLERGFMHVGGKEVRYQWLLPGLKDIFGNDIIEMPQ